MFYIADYAIFAILCAVGTQAMLSRLWAVRHSARPVLLGGVVVALVAIIPPLIYAAVPSVIQMAGVRLFSSRSVAYRDNVTFFLNPNKRGYDGARRFAEEAFSAVKPNAVIFADHTPYAVLRYLQFTEGTRSDILVPRLGGDVSRVRWTAIDGTPRPTYIAAAPQPGYYDLSALTGEFDVVPVGPIFEVRLKAPVHRAN